MKPMVMSLLLSVLVAGSAQASSLCYVQVAGAINPFGISDDDLTTDNDERFFLSKLRDAGIIATSVEEWGGCVRAYVRLPDGTEEMQLLHPQTFQRVG